MAEGQDLQPPSSEPDSGVEAPRVLTAQPEMQAEPEVLAVPDVPAEPDIPAEPDRYAVTTYTPPEPEVKFADRVPRTPEERAAALVRRANRRRRRKILGWSMLGAGVLILAGTAWIGWRSYQAYQHLTSASAQVATLQDQLKDITDVDTTGTAATVDKLQSESAAARSAVADPIFRAASVIPFVGPNLDAIREVTLTVDSLATEVMPSLVDIAVTLQPSQLAPTGGVIDLAPIERISPLLQNADTAVNLAREQMSSIDRDAVVQPVGDAVLTLWRKLDEAADVIGPGARAARLLPPMLGADGPRTYLVAFQNPAERRATGGIFGSYAVVHADQGKISIVDQGASSRTLGTFDPPVADLSEADANLYAGPLNKYPADVNLTPDFPSAARLFAEMYRVRTGSTVDGVMAIDPVALSYMLKGTAPINVGDGVSVTSDNLVSILLSTAYQKFDEWDQSERDTFLANATADVFSQMMSGSVNPTAMLSGLRRAAAERRVLVYSANEAEQADIAGTTIAGSLDTPTDLPTIGVFLNDGIAAKLGYYLSSEAHVTAGACQPDGRRELKVRVVMNYHPPADGLPSYVTGFSDLGKAYTLRTNLLVFAPVGGGIVGAERDGSASAVGVGEDHSRAVATTAVVMAPGSSTELVFTILGPGNVDGIPDDITPELMLTPGIEPWVTSVDSYRDCRVAAN